MILRAFKGMIRDLLYALGIKFQLKQLNTKYVPRSPTALSVALQFDSHLPHNEANYFSPTSHGLLKQSRADCGLTDLIFLSNTPATLCVATISKGGFDFEHFPGSNHIDQEGKQRCLRK